MTGSLRPNTSSNHTCLLAKRFLTSPPDDTVEVIEKEKLDVEKKLLIGMIYSCPGESWIIKQMLELDKRYRPLKKKSMKYTEVPEDHLF